MSTMPVLPLMPVPDLSLATTHQTPLRSRVLRWYLRCTMGVLLQNSPVVDGIAKGISFSSPLGQCLWTLITVPVPWTSSPPEFHLTSSVSFHLWPCLHFSSEFCLVSSALPPQNFSPWPHAVGPTGPLASHFWLCMSSPFGILPILLFGPLANDLLHMDATYSWLALPIPVTCPRLLLDSPSEFTLHYLYT